ncbi:MAG: hypothetical protein NZ742_08250 [Acidobacteria bacterium]|nr:hypothetical protein [Acidobacteriota bacterium]MDW7984760.1 JAB domain-containing protein [Acidobacteriota bacterium]
MPKRGSPQVCVLLAYGTTHRVAVRPREILRAAIRQNTVSVILIFILFKFIRLIQNPPDGRALPSVEDRQLTRALQIAGSVVGVDVYEPIIVAESRVFSLRQSDLLTGLR